MSSNIISCSIKDDPVTLIVTASSQQMVMLLFLKIPSLTSACDHWRPFCDHFVTKRLTACQIFHSLLTGQQAMKMFSHYFVCNKVLGAVAATAFLQPKWSHGARRRVRTTWRPFCDHLQAFCNQV